MSKVGLTPEGIERVENYRAEVVEVFNKAFVAELARFPDGPKLLQRFDDAVQLALKGGSLRAVGELHNEMCVARSLLLSTKTPFTALAYEPPLPGCAKTIDFRGVTSDGVTVYVDVKTFKPEPKDKWEQFERAREDDLIPENVIVGLFKEWMGGEIWHGWFAARGRMLEYTLELEQKIREGLNGKTNIAFCLALCGTGFEWHESLREDFVDFYGTGRYRSDDSFAKMEAHYMAKARLSLDQTIARFCYI